MSRTLTRRVDRVADLGARRTDPVLSDSDLEGLTAEECEAAAAVRERLDAVGLAGIPDADRDFCNCLNERLSGQRVAPCVLGAE